MRAAAWWAGRWREGGGVRLGGLGDGIRRAWQWHDKARRRRRYRRVRQRQ